MLLWVPYRGPALPDLGAGPRATERVGGVCALLKATHLSRKVYLLESTREPIHRSEGRASD